MADDIKITRADFELACKIVAALDFRESPLDTVAKVLAEHHEDQENRIAELEGENARLHALAKANNDLARHEGSGRKSAMREVTVLREALTHLVRSLDELIAESGGVYGLHMNGDPAPWSSLTEGGHFEEWLIELERARAALNQEKNNG